MEIKVYPRVFESFKKQKIYFELSENCEELFVKIQGMEKYTVPHKDWRIDESYRYPLLSLTKERENLYSLEYDFKDEQRYCIGFKSGDKYIKNAYVYAVNSDLARLRVFKGDTHLHTTGSDGAESPFDTAISFRKAGFDFIAITDHHKMAPSLEGKEKVEALTSYLSVFRGEEVHNKDMGYFHIVNFGGKTSVNTIIETNEAYVQQKLDEIKKSESFPENVNIDNCAFRIFVANEIRRGGGLAIFAHPFWEDYGEYNAETEDAIFLLKNGYFDALEVLAGCDYSGTGNNLQESLWCELRAMGVNIPVLGASDSHRTQSEPTKFNKQFSLVFAEKSEDIPSSVKRGLSVAVERRSGVDFRCIGQYRFVKYARYLMDSFYPEYEELCRAHAEALALCENSAPSEVLRLAEKRIDEYKARFFAFGI